MSSFWSNKRVWVTGAGDYAQANQGFLQIRPQFLPKG